MTGNDIFTRAMLLLGYNDHNGSVAGEQALKVRALEAINTVGFELCKMPEAKSLEDILDLTPAVVDAIPYGVGMILASSEGDGERGRLFCEIYNLKRAAVRARVQSVKDSLPICGG